MVAPANLNGAGGRGTKAPPTLAPPPASPALFTAEALKMQRMMRVNPLPMLNPQMLGIWMDQFNYGMLRQFVLLVEAMCERDDTLITVKPQLENAVASKDWGVFPIKGADETEAARHVACLNYFYDHMRVTDAYDRNVRGGRDKLLQLMMTADTYKYAAFHIVWQPQPGKTVTVSPENPKSSSSQRSDLNPSTSQPSSVPVISATIEFVPLWFFENTTGELRFLRDGGFGIIGRPLSDFGDWMICTGRGLMFAAAPCYTFKRLTFQDWTIFNERYAQNKVVGVTAATKESAEGQAMAAVVAAFNEDQGLVFYEWSGDSEKPPISLLGPDGTASVEIWDKFIERQDRKMSSMYRGNDLSMMSRAGKGEKPTGASLQEDEGDDMESGACRRVAGDCQESLDRRIIEICFGAGVEPLAYFGLADMNKEDTTELRDSAEFLVKHGARVSLSDTAERLGIQLVPETEGDDDILEPPAPISVAAGVSPADDPDNPDPARLPSRSRAKAGDRRTANAQLQSDIEQYLGPLVPKFKKAFADDLIPLGLALDHVLKATPGDFTANARALQAQLPWLADQILPRPRTAPVLVEIIEKAMERAIEEAEIERRAAA